MANIISAGESLFQKELVEIELDKIIERIRLDPNLREAVEAIRAETDKDKREVLKKQLPIFCAGVYKGGRRLNDALSYAEYFVFDFDHLDEMGVEQLKAGLSKTKSALAVFVSPSGQGVKMICRLSAPIMDAAHYTATYKYYLGKLEGYPGLDKAVNDPARVTFLSSDPDIFVNMSARPLDITKFDEEYLATTAPKGKSGYREVKSFTEGNIELVETAVEFLRGKLSSYVDYYRVGMALTNVEPYEKGLELFLKVAENPAYPGDTADKLTKQFAKWAKVSRGAITLGTVVWIAETNGFKYEKKKKSEREESGTIYDRLAEFLNARYRFRYNSLEERIYFWNLGVDGDIAPDDPPDGTALDDYLLNTIHIQSSRAGIALGFDAFNRFLISEFTPRYNPVVEYFSALPDWDGNDYIGDLSETVRCGEDDKTFKDSLKRWMVAAVACVLTEETNRMALILQGSQNIGKTRWLNKLAPPALRKYTYVGNIRDDKDSFLEIVKKFLINLDELEALDRDDYSSIKSIMSKKYYDIRKPYGRTTEKYCRVSSFVGSVNKDDFLQDPTGSTRFLVHEAIAVLCDHDVDIDKCWAQAKHYFQKGERYWLNEAEGKALSDKNDQFALTSMEEELLLASFRPTQREALGQWFTTTELTIKLFGDRTVNNTNVRRMGAALTKNGFLRMNRRMVVEGQSANVKMWLAESHQMVQRDGELPF